MREVGGRGARWQRDGDGYGEGAHGQGGGTGGGSHGGGRRPTARAPDLFESGLARCGYYQSNQLSGIYSCRINATFSGEEPLRWLRTK
jgi:hypothetical protein